MNNFQACLTNDIRSWLKDNNLKYKEVNSRFEKGSLSILCSDRFYLKVYDCLGHGFGVNINVAEEYDESLYANEVFNLTWAYKYLNITETASFNSRKESQYLQNLPNLINDLKQIIPRFNQMDSIEWNKMKEWIKNEAFKHFS